MRTTILSIQKLKDTGQRVPMLTAYDATSARLVEAAGVPIILVGDSLGMTIQGHETTVPVTLDDIIYHTRAVVRGTSKAMIVFDLPFMTYTVSPEQALISAGRAIQEGGANAVKMEGGAHMAPTVARVVEAGIPVMAHIGLTPQSVYQLGGWRIQGRDPQSAQRLIEDALALERAGAFAIVLETIPTPVAKEITARLHIPTIGIGAGPYCDGQVQVFHDLLGLIENLPKHAKKYAALGDAIRQAVSAYVEEVQSGSFPTEAQSFPMDEAALAALYGQLQGGNGDVKKKA
jgi:3-methyl-2-oxobutanoate hydroxymethyltransferase